MYHLSYHFRSKFNESDAIIFHAFHQGAEQDAEGRHFIPIPKDRNPRQKYIFMTKESPYYTSIYFTHDFPMKDTYNLTMTYHKDSDIQMPYGYIKKIHTSQQLTNKESLWNTNYSANRTKQVLWFVSHSHAPSGRDDYVEELGRFIKVDIFGKAVKKPVVKGAPTEKLYKSYKFFLSFENAICKEYITEKIWNALQMGLIPIVLGGGNYEKLLPPNSFINIANFSSPKHLADYIALLDENEVLYTQYFDWRKNYTIAQNRGSWYPVCDLCQLLYKSHHMITTRDISGLYTYNAACETKDTFFHNISLPLKNIDYFSRSVTSKWIGT